MTIHEAYRLQEFEEVVGDLRNIKKTENGLLVRISKFNVILPVELFGKLQGLMGRRVAVLKLDGFHVRCLE